MAKPLEKSRFVVAVSLLDNDRVYAGLARGNMFTGQKHEVTSSFIEAVISWGSCGGEKGGARIVASGDDRWEVTVKKLRPAKRRKS